MKKIFSLLILLYSGLIISQNTFDKYEDMKGVTSVIVTEDMFEMLGSITPESNQAKEELSLLKDLTELKIFTSDDINLKNQFIQDFENYIKKRQMKELMRINDDDAQVKFYAIKGEQPYLAKELVMLLIGKNKQNKQIVLMDITGNIDLRKLSKLNAKVKVVDKKYFEEVEKNIKKENNE